MDIISSLIPQTEIDAYLEAMIEILNVSGRELLCIGDVAHRPAINSAYKAGLKKKAIRISHHYEDYGLVADLIKAGNVYQLKNYLRTTQNIREGVLESRGAILRMIGEDDPGILGPLSQSHPEMFQVYLDTFSECRRMWKDYGIDEHFCSWLIVAFPSEGWARLVHPNLEPKEAILKLWSEIKKMTGMLEKDPIAYVTSWGEKLLKRSQTLQKMNVKTIRVKGGGSDFTIGFQPEIKWLAAQSLTTDGRIFTANWPSYEVFTTPDWRTAEGTLKVTRPVISNGSLLEGLTLTFKNGRIESFTAEKGKESFDKILSMDVGARQSGEFALVGKDAPLWDFDHPFYEILIDENCRSHLAIGDAYLDPLSEQLKTSSKENLGINSSNLHLDLMIGSDEVDFIATLQDGTEITLLHRGEWNEILK